MWNDFKIARFFILAGCLAAAIPIRASSQNVNETDLTGHSEKNAEIVSADALAPDLSFLQQSDTTEYLWPTDASPYLSSTFGETRSAHFHAGLDIRTWGQEGYRVFATRDGIVYRIGIGPRGYGKVIYLKHDDNSYSVYAHLNRFESTIQNLADSIRLQDFSFELDRLVSDQNIRVKQGDLIGYTGSTGVGPPHLHFELRTPDNQPFNPLLTNLGVDDDLPPVFSSLAVEHLDPTSFQTQNIDRVSPSGSTPEYHFGTVRTNGPVGLAVDVHDRANRTPNAYAVYHLTAVHEGDTLFHSQADYFSYRDASQMFIDRVYSILKEHRRGYQRLFVVNGNTLPFYQKIRNRGVIDLPEGRHELQLIASDYYGNKSIAGVTLDVHDRDQRVKENITGVPAYGVSDLEIQNARMQDLSRLDSREVNPVYFVDASTVRPTQTSSPHPLYRTDADYQMYQNQTTQVLRKTLVPGKRQFVHLPDQTIWLDFPENALFDTLDIVVKIENTDGLPVIRFSPEFLPLNNGIYVNVILQEDHNLQNPAGLYTYNSRNGRYTLQSDDPGNSRLIRAKVNQLQSLFVRTDNTPPLIGTPRIQKNLGDQYVVIVPARDQLSGIDYKKSTLTVNGQRGIVEYEADKDRLIYYHPDFLPEPENRVEIQVYDGLGNVYRNTITGITL